MPVRGRPRDPERSRRVLEAARAHVYAHGLERASLDAIAADAARFDDDRLQQLRIEGGLVRSSGPRTHGPRDGGLAGVDTLDPQQPRKAPAIVGEQFLMLMRDEEALSKFRSVYGAAGRSPRPATPSIARGPSDRRTNWRCTCVAFMPRAR
jgi:TetR/AcrR family transcriptional repressor of mexJK operon